MNELEIKLNSLWNHSEIERNKAEAVDSKLSDFATVDEVRAALKEFKSEFTSKIGELREDLNKLDKFKAGVDATNEALSQKADAYLVEQFLERKADKTDVESLKTQVATVKTDCLPKDLWDNANKQIKHALEEI